MRRFLLVLLLCVAGCAPQSESPYAGPKAIGYRDGSVIFWRGGLLAGPILRRTGSDITHVAIILYHRGEPWVYESVPPRVHKVPLRDYLVELRLKQSQHPKRNLTWFTMQPKVPYAQHELTAMKWYAESQLGRPYMLRGWWKGREVRGLFCSQYVGNIIEQTGLIESSNWRESPGSLHDKLSLHYQ
jgi:hypothetical protein